MNKLSKSKSFSVSNEIIEVNFKGTICECANLLKSGIMNQTIILVGHDDKWHEINALDLGADNSDLQSFKQFIEVMKLSLVDLGITKEEIKTDYTLKHQDFLDLQSEFPAFDYIQISRLNDSNAKIHLSQSVYELRQWLKVCQRDKISIDELISNREIEKSKIIMKPEKIEELEIGTDGQTAIPVEETKKEFKAYCPNVIGSAKIIETITPMPFPVEKIEVIDAVVLAGTGNTPITATPAKKPVSVQVFENFTPERISELVGLKEKQLEIVKANPVVKITDKTSYEKAKKTAATLLKASTAIDGKDGVDALGVRCINAFKKMFSSETGIIAKLTRDPYDEQKIIISSWENAELLREQAEQRAKLAKIKARTDELFAVPFTFNGSVYSIGTVYCLPSQIESVTDEEFKVIVDNGKVIKQALDAEALKNAEKDKEIEELRKKLAALEGLQNMSNTDEPKTAEQPAQASVQQPTPTTDKVADFMNPNHVPSNVTQKTAATGVSTTGLAYALPSIENTILNKLDLENAEHLEKPAYIKCRSYFIRGSKELAVEIQKILNDTAPNALKKSERIDNLCNVILKSE